MATIRSLLLFALSSVLAAACGGDGWDLEGAVKPGACPPGDVIARGEVVRATEPFTYLGPFEYGPDSAGRVVLTRIPANSADVRSEPVAAQTFAPITALPFSFCLTGVVPQDPGAWDYLISAEVRQGAGGLEVGDLLSEFRQSIKPPAEQITIEVYGLEACGTAGAGGSCR